MGMGSYKKNKALVFSMHSEKIFAGWAGHFFLFWHALSVPEGNM